MSINKRETPDAYARCTARMRARSAGTMSERLCRVGGCERPAYRARTLCNHHAMRRFHYGDELAEPPPRRRAELAGQRFGLLVALERVDARQAWRCQCDCGAETIVRTWSLTSGGTRSCGQRRRHLTPTSYHQAHEHVNTLRGPARDHACRACGRPAQQWSFNRRDHEHERVTPEGWPWSPDPGDYEPLCVSCHKRADLAAIRADAAAAHGATPLIDPDDFDRTDDWRRGF
ncbi:hypothetical protein [Agromyces larvae]|uniref:HNH endonuclease n=1 Tax=Agromyces larvae TaxID=2929802 RepID=A0ABY4C5N4_9MICO|nr:hypothetical protein [Agromyces larvae]UOE45283.1 hypothetical protein MTO99_05830 [Agromyces larvae]